MAMKWVAHTPEPDTRPVSSSQAARTTPLAPRMRE
jgi:hypothetical protein